VRDDSWGADDSRAGNSHQGGEHENLWAETETRKQEVIGFRLGGRVLQPTIPTSVSETERNCGLPKLYPTE
jgi:hypothetical protein